MQCIETKGFVISNVSGVSDSNVILKLKEDHFWKRNNGHLTIEVMPTISYDAAYKETIKGSYSLLKNLYMKFGQQDACDIITRHHKEIQRKYKS